MNQVDVAKLPLMLASLRLPTVKQLWQPMAKQADEQGWGAARFLAVLCEHEIADRQRRRIERHLAQSGLPKDKTLSSFDFTAVSSLNKNKVMALANADSWLQQGHNILIFGPSGTGKSHLSAAIATSLIEQGRRALFMRAAELVQKLQAARRDLALPQMLAKLDRFDLLILDDLGYVRADHAETNVLFELIAERYERKSMIVTANQPFSEWNKVFPDEAMTVAAIDRLVHHATIFELNTESYRRKTAINNLNPNRPS